MNAESNAEILRGRLLDLERRIAAACERASRKRSEVTLVAVTKTVSAEIAALLPDLGVRDIGENRPQELWAKSAALPSDVRWHLIGHFQRNKVERTLPLVSLIHAADSERLILAISKEAARQGRVAEILIEVNVSGEKSKQGMTLELARELAPTLGRLPALHLRGFMTMAPFEDDPQRCRPVFAALRQLRDELRPCIDPSNAFGELSMGMTNDFEVAIEEGATFIRVGTALFEGLAT